MRPQGASPDVNRYFEGAYTPVYNDYLSKLGKQAVSGGIPDLQFPDFLNTYNWAKRYLGQGFAGRLNALRTLSPRTYWDVY